MALVVGPEPSDMVMVGLKLVSTMVLNGGDEVPLSDEERQGLWLIISSLCRVPSKPLVRWFDDRWPHFLTKECQIELPFMYIIIRFFISLPIPYNVGVNGFLGSHQAFKDSGTAAC